MVSPTGEPDPKVEILPQKRYLEVRFLGDFKVARFKEQVDLAVAACKERKGARLLLDYSPLGPTIPGTMDRYEISAHAARVAVNIKIAGLARPEQIGEKFGKMVARNRGLNVDVFADRKEAIDWLLKNNP